MREALAERGVFSLLDGRLDTPRQRSCLVPAAAMLLLAWIAIVAYLGPYVGSVVAEAAAAVIPRDMLMGGALTALGLSALVAWSRNAGPLALLAVALLTYIGGTVLSSVGFRLVALSGVEGWVRFVLQRIGYGVAVVTPMALLLVVARRAWGPAMLGRGGWSATTRLLTRRDKPTSWARGLRDLAVGAGLPVMLLMQLSVGFRPVLSGDLLWFAGPVLAMSLVNATVEEYIFRGCIQPAVVHCAGAGRGLWLQGLFFGLHHFGMSVALLATLPGAILIGIGSVVFGKSVLETRGMAWAIAAHAVFDIGVFAAYGMEF